jgi:hypothetical protein
MMLVVQMVQGELDGLMERCRHRCEWYGRLNLSPGGGAAAVRTRGGGSTTRAEANEAVTGDARDTGSCFIDPHDDGQAAAVVPASSLRSINRHSSKIRI